MIHKSVLQCMHIVPMMGSCKDPISGLLGPDFQSSGVDLLEGFADRDMVVLARTRSIDVDGTRRRLENSKSVTSDSREVRLEPVVKKRLNEILKLRLGHLYNDLVISMILRSVCLCFDLPSGISVTAQPPPPAPVNLVDKW